MADEKIQLESALSAEALLKQLAEIRAEAVQTIKDLNESYEKLRLGNNEAAQQIGNLLNRVTEQRKQIEALTVQLTEMAKGNKAAFDDTAAKKYQEQIAGLRAEIDKMKKDSADSLKPLNDETKKGAPLVAALKDKLRGLREEQLLIKGEIKDYNQSLAKNEQQIKLVDAQLGGLIKTSKTYREDQAKLTKEIDGLRDKQGKLTTGLLDSKDALEKNTVEIKNTSKELAAAQTGAGGFGAGMLKLLPVLRSVAAALPGLGIGTLILALVTPIIELGKALFGLSDAQKKAEETAGKLVEVQLKGLSAASESRVEMEALLLVARDTTRSEAERLAAIRKINEAMPEYNNQINLENINTDATQKAIDRYIESMGKKAKAQAFISVIQKAYNDLIALELQLTLANAAGNAGILDVVKNRIQKTIDLQKEQIKTLEQNFKLDLETGKAEIDLTKQLEANEKDIDKNKKERIKQAGDAAKDIAALTKKHASDQAKADREAAEALREREAQLRRVADLEKQLATLRAQLAGEGRQTDIAAEDARFKNAIDQLNLLRGLAKTTVEEKKLIDQLIETQSLVHYKKLGEIDQKYYEDAIKAFTDAQNQVDQLLLKDQDKETAAIDAKYKKLFDQIEIARKKVLDTAKDNPLVKSSINFEFDSKLADLIEQQKKDQAAIVKKYDLKALDEAEALGKAQADIIQVNGINHAALVRVREIAKLNIEIEFAKKRLELLKATGDPKDDLRIAQLTKAIEDAQNKLKKIGDNDGKSFLEFLGLNDKDIDNLYKALRAAQAVATVVDNVTGVIIDGIDKQIEAKQKLIDSIQEGIDKQQEAVDRERELAEAGLANSLGIEEQRLAAMQKAKEDELEQEKKLKKEKAALQKAQIVADSVAQVSNIITASSEIFKAFSVIPVVGVPLAIAAIALMIGAFVASKAQAIKAAKAESFRHGGEKDLSKALDGKPSHESGGVDLVDNKSGQKIAEFEGDEKLFIVNKGKAAKYKTIIEAINKDELKDWPIERFIHEKSGTVRTVTNTSKTDTVTIAVDRDMATKYKTVIDAIQSGKLATWTEENFYHQKIKLLKDQVTENNRRISINEQTIATFKKDMSDLATTDRRRMTRETVIDRMEKQNNRLVSENLAIHRRINEVLEARTRNDRKSYTLDEIFQAVEIKRDTKTAEKYSQDSPKNIPPPAGVRAGIQKTVQDKTKIVQETQTNAHRTQLNAHNVQLIEVRREIAETHRDIIDAIRTRSINTWTIERIMNSIDRSHSDRIDTGHTHHGRSRVDHSVDHAHTDRTRTDSDYRLSREIYTRYKKVLDAIDSGTLHKWTSEDIYDFKSTIHQAIARPADRIIPLTITDQLTLATDSAKVTTDRLRAMIQPSGITFNQVKITPTETQLKAMIAMQEKKAIDYSETLDRIARSNESILAMERDKETTTETATHKIIKKGNHVRMVRKTA